MLVQISSTGQSDLLHEDELDLYSQISSSFEPEDQEEDEEDEDEEDEDEEDEDLEDEEEEGN